MATYDVFISWGSPDKEIVIPLAARLRDVGLRVFEYTHEMAFGNQIADRIQAALYDSTVAIVCLSQQSWDREWIITEVAWIETALRNRTLRQVIPLAVGAMGATASLPALLRQKGLFTGNLADGPDAEATLESLVDTVFEAVGIGKPLWLPAAVFAMTDVQFDGLMAPRQEFLQLGTYLGMDPAFLPTLRTRYRDSPAAFSPFPGGPAVAVTVQSAVARLNVKRRERGLPPIHLRWMNADLVHPDNDRRRRARDRWGRRSSLMLIDSLSMFDLTVRGLVTSLAAQRDRTAVVWIPPYTGRTGELERLIDTATQDFDQLNDCVRHWYQPVSDPTVEVRKRVFDVGTHAGLWHWLFLMLADLDDRYPDAERRAEVTALAPGPTTSPSRW